MRAGWRLLLSIEINARECSAAASRLTQCVSLTLRNDLFTQPRCQPVHTPYAVYFSFFTFSLTVIFVTGGTRARWGCHGLRDWLQLASATLQRMRMVFQARTIIRRVSLSHSLLLQNRSAAKSNARCAAQDLQCCWTNQLG